MTSFVSAKGPSVIVTFPPLLFCTRTPVAPKCTPFGCDQPTRLHAVLDELAHRFHFGLRRGAVSGFVCENADEAHVYPPGFNSVGSRHRCGGYARFVFERRRSLSRITSVMSSTGRISNGPAFRPGCFDTNRMASSISLASNEKNPPICSLVSAYGPSVITTLLFRKRNVLAFRTPWKASPPIGPFLRSTSSYARQSSMKRC